MRIEIIRKISKLSRTVYVFWFKIDTGCQLILDAYSEEYKDNTRQRKWRQEENYSRLFSRFNTVKYEDIDIPLDVIAEAKQYIIDQVQNLTVSEKC